LNAGVWPEPDFALYDVLAWAEGYSAVLQTDVGMHPQTPTVLNFLLPAAASISVLVTDELSSPIAGALVCALQTDGIGAGSSVWAETDSSGEAVLANLQAPGTYQVSVGLDVSRLPAGGTYALAPGDSVSDELVLILAPRISGVVQDSITGLPIAGASIYVTGPDSEIQSDVGTDAEGRYRVYGVRSPATYSIEAVAAGYLLASTSVQVSGQGETEAPLLKATPEEHHGAYLLVLL
ncbi:MAG: carboxypeptidase regulatory-like domain-containing protein, partial [Armatimonadetes bacterium]|nr:carboxypeptidase regulatory-like domain-containing protein [Armatimonadota bacterium]